MRLLAPPPAALVELCDLVDHLRIYNAADSMADVSFLDDLDGVLIAIAPTTASFEEDQYEKVYGQAVPALLMPFVNGRDPNRCM